MDIAPLDRTPPRLPTHALPVLRAISSSTQCNACNARNAKYSRSGQWHGWNFHVIWHASNLKHVLDHALLVSALRTAPYIDAFRTRMYSTATCVTIGPRASIYGDVRCHKAHSHCIQRRILLARMWKYGNVRRRKSSYVDRTLQMLKLYVTVIYCNMPHKLRSCAACCISRRTTCSLCERAQLQCRRMSRYGARCLTCLRLETGL